MKCVRVCDTNVTDYAITRRYSVNLTISGRYTHRLCEIVAMTTMTMLHFVRCCCCRHFFFAAIASHRFSCLLLSTNCLHWRRCGERLQTKSNETLKEKKPRYFHLKLAWRNRHRMNSEMPQIRRQIWRKEWKMRREKDHQSGAPIFSALFVPSDFLWHF